MRSPARREQTGDMITGARLRVDDPANALPVPRGALRVAFAHTGSPAADAAMAGAGLEMFLRQLLHTGDIVLDAVEARPADEAGRHVVWLWLADSACLRAGRDARRQLLAGLGCAKASADFYVTAASCDTAAAAEAELLRIATFLPITLKLVGVSRPL